MGVLGIVRHLDSIIGPGVMLLFPLYASMRAIESPSTLDDQQWLTYWVLYSFITLFELSFWKILVWIPIWPYLKLVFCMWLKKVLQMMSLDARKSVEQYIHRYGPDAFDRVIKAAEKEARKR
ncbi:HVA22-like protein [Quillaja saponaria]|uniref:HVA22-like protein n=1 Tax=Quillaja saponaria TaxID=32244 RepID=A0AAD7LPM9_QUISA|nr:HVA22-like protein [Quillaja saponaria]